MFGENETWRANAMENNSAVALNEARPPQIRGISALKKQGSNFLVSNWPSAARLAPNPAALRE